MGWGLFECQPLRYGQLPSCKASTPTTASVACSFLAICRQIRVNLPFTVSLPNKAWQMQRWLILNTQTSTSASRKQCEFQSSNISWAGYNTPLFMCGPLTHPLKGGRGGREKRGCCLSKAGTSTACSFLWNPSMTLSEALQQKMASLNDLGATTADDNCSLKSDQILRNLKKSGVRGASPWRLPHLQHAQTTSCAAKTISKDGSDEMHPASPGRHSLKMAGSSLASCKKEARNPLGWG